MKTIKKLHAILVLLSFLFGSQYAQGQLLGGIPDPNFLPKDVGKFAPPLNFGNQVFWPAPDSGIFVDNPRQPSVSVGPILAHDQIWYNKESGFVKNLWTCINSTSPGSFQTFNSGFLRETSYRNYYLVNGYLKVDTINNQRRDDSIYVNKLNLFEAFTLRKPNQAFFVKKPFMGNYNTGLVQIENTGLAFWMTQNLSDSSKIHNSTFLKLLNLDGFPQSVEVRLQNFAAEAGTFLNGNLILIGYEMNDTIRVRTKIQVLNASTLNVVSGLLPNLPVNLLNGKIQIFRPLPDGKMLIAGNMVSPFITGEQLLRLQISGAIDLSFSPTFLTGNGKTLWTINDQNVIRVASSNKSEGQPCVVTTGIVQANGGIISQVQVLDQDWPLCNPIMYHPDLDAHLFESVVIFDNRLGYWPGPDNSPYATKHRFYVKPGSFVRPLLNVFAIGHSWDRNPEIFSNPAVNKLYVTGEFTQVQGKLYPKLARLNPDGFLDTTYKSILALKGGFGTWLRSYMVKPEVFPTKNGKLLLNFTEKGKDYLNAYWNDSLVIKYSVSTVRLNGDGSEDESYKPIMMPGKMLPTGDSGFVAARSYTDGRLNFSLLSNTPNPTFIKILKLNTEGDSISEFGEFNITSGLPDTNINTVTYIDGRTCHIDAQNGVWVLVRRFFNTEEKNYLARIHPSGQTSFLSPNFIVDNNPFKIELLPGKGFRLTGVFRIADGSTFGKVFNIVETDSLGRIDLNIPTKKLIPENVFGIRRNQVLYPILNLPDGKFLSILAGNSLQEGIRGIYRFKSNGDFDKSFIPIRMARSEESVSFFTNLNNKLYVVSELRQANNGNLVYGIGNVKKNGLYAFEQNAAPANTAYATGRVTQVISPATGCTPPNQKAGKSMIIKASPSNQITISDTGGYYTMPLTIGNYSLRQTISNEFLQRQICPLPASPARNVSLTSAGTVSFENDFINQTFDCPRLDLQINQPRFRLCSRSQFRLFYKNDGVAAQPNSRIRLSLPQEVNIEFASLSFTKQADSSYVFDLGTLNPGQSGQILIKDTVSCPVVPDSLARACFSARIEPLSLCSNIDPSTLLWDGAWLDAEARFVPTLNKVKISIFNRGSNMADSTACDITGPGVIYKRGKIKLSAGDSLIFWVDPAVRGNIQVFLAQPKDCPLGLGSGLAHSGTGVAKTFLNFGPGLFETNTVQACPSWRFSYDPNEKLVEPEGEVEPETDFNYTIHFENYGNDTAYFVAVVDSLPNQLDVSTLRLGGSSHPYTLQIGGNEQNPILSFIFNPIKLTGKRQDSVLSKGQLSFKIKMKAGVNRGEVVSNRAHIYFDRNEPVITEFVHSKVRELGVPVLSTNAKSSTENRMILAPNPASGTVKIWFTNGGQTKQNAQTIRVSTMEGKLVKEIDAQNGFAEVKGLSDGIYVVSSAGFEPQQLIVIQ